MKGLIPRGERGELILASLLICLLIKLEVLSLTRTLQSKCLIKEKQPAACTIKAPTFFFFFLTTHCK